MQQLRENERKTRAVAIVTALAMGLEIAAGYWTGSMALLADGWHMSSHAAALGVNLFIYWLSRRLELKQTHTFSTSHLLSLGGLISSLILIGIAAGMLVESIRKLYNPESILFQEALFVAVFGLLINLWSAWVLHSEEDHHSHEHHHHSHDDDHHHHHTHDHNIKSAYLHVLADALTSVLAIFAILMAQYASWIWMDPLVGIIGSLVVVKWGYGLFVETSGKLIHWKKK